MKALISPNEILYLPNNETGQRVAEVSETAFEVATPLFWVACADDVMPDVWYYDPTDQQIKLVPQPEQPESVIESAS